MAKWYYKHGEKEIGPIDEAIFFEWLQKGSILPEVLVRSDEMTEWKEAGFLNPAVPDADELASSDDPARVEYEVTLEDLVTFYESQIYKYTLRGPLEKLSPRNRCPLWVFVAALLVTILVWSLITAVATGQGVMVAVGLFYIFGSYLGLLAIFYLINACLIGSAKVKKDAADAASAHLFLGRWGAMASKDSLAFQSTRIDQAIRWAGVQTIADGTDAIYILANGLHIIPKRAFGDDKSARAFLRAVRRFYSDALDAAKRDELPASNG